jgi:DNA polymerase-3 subunit epsilon
MFIKPVGKTGFFVFTSAIFVAIMYAIVDIETTGGNPKKDKITEIAVVIHDGQKVIHEFSTLINPECRIPYHISSLTGITNEMVAGSPKFYEVAKELVELTSDHVFVAHNVAFDYNFVRSEFQRLGYDYRREQLCTVRLSRKILPGHQSYSLGRLCDDLKISINGRHRAMGDAAATTILFELLVQEESRNNTNYIAGSDKTTGIKNPLLDPKKLKCLPEVPGVYYFYNQQAELVYIGKSKNIKSRVLSHFSNYSSGKAMRMQTMVADVDCECTGSELIALLRESHEIKQHKPVFNRRQRRSMFRYELCSFSDDQGYIRFALEKTSERQTSPLNTFTTKAEAHGFLNRMIERFSLCQKLCGVYPSENHCFHYEIGACKGACIGKEPPEKYNLRAKKLIDVCRFGYHNLLIIDEGRNRDEKSVVKIEKGKYIGFGYFTPSYQEYNPDILHECIASYPDNREVQQIIRQYIHNNNVERIIEY